MPNPASGNGERVDAIRKEEMPVRHTQESVVENEVPLVVLSGFEGAMIGYAERYGFADSVACYDRDGVIAILMNKSSMTHEQAEIYFEEKIMTSHFGESTPVFVTIDPSVSH